MGQDVSAACGQLAVDNKNRRDINIGKSENKMADIEDSGFGIGGNISTSNVRLVPPLDTVAGLIDMEVSEGSGVVADLETVSEDRLRKGHSTLMKVWEIKDTLAVTAVATGVFLGALAVYRAVRVSRS
jgi:hypothetical protein